MAGDTLRGIGKKELAESAESAESPDPQSESAPDRATEPMGSVVAREAALAVLEDEARPLRSLDDLPSDRTGRPPAAGPVVDDAVPLPATPSTPRSGPNRVSFGTMIGHEMHSVQARIAAAIADVDSGARGTAHGHDVHLPPYGGATSEPEGAPRLSPTAPRAAAVPASATATVSAGTPKPVTHDDLGAFSGGDHSFFETDPVNDEYEPENPRARFYTRLAVSGAVVAVVAVVVFAWVHSHGSNDEAPATETASAPVAPAPAPPSAPALMPAPSPAPPVIPVIPARPAPIARHDELPEAPTLPRVTAKATAKAPTPPTRSAPSAPPAPPSSPVAAREAKTPAAARETPAAAPRERKTAPVAATPPAARPIAKSTTSAAGAKTAKGTPARGKAKYDPDGTLPLSFD